MRMPPVPMLMATTPTDTSQWLPSLQPNESRRGRAVLVSPNHVLEYKHNAHKEYSMQALYIVLILVALLVIAFIVIYNRLVTLKIEVDEAWSDITVQLKRRYDLIPNLVNTVKGYATHEKSVFEDVTKARAQAMQARGPAETAKAENQFSQTLKSLFAVAENYPQLRASENFQQLQDQLTDT